MIAGFGYTATLDGHLKVFSSDLFPLSDLTSFVLDLFVRIVNPGRNLSGHSLATI